MAYTTEITGAQLAGNASLLSSLTLNLLDKIRNSKAFYTQMLADLKSEYARRTSYYLAVSEGGGPDTEPADNAAVAAVWGTGCTLDDWKCAKVVDREFISFNPKMFYDYRSLVNTRLYNLSQFASGVAGLTAVDLAATLGAWSW